jgi:hypothetical protein
MPTRWLSSVRRVAEDVRRAAKLQEAQLEVARRSERRTRRQLGQIMETLEEQRALLARLQGGSTKIEAELKTLRVARTETMMREVHEFVTTRQMSYEETLEQLAQGEVSFARFGDGELRLMVDPMYRLGFQVNGAGLRSALEDTLRQERRDLLLGWPRAFWTAHIAMQWSIVWDGIRELVPPGTRFGNSHVSRPDCFEALGREAVELWRKVWDGKQITVVTGHDSRFELPDALFDNIAGHDVVHSTPRNAFADLERLESEILARPGATSELHLVALGPAGTVLAARLAAVGVRAIDVGHISNSYRYVIEGAPYPESLPGARRGRPAS